jgi:hypothetical protein
VASILEQDDRIARPEHLEAGKGLDKNLEAYCVRRMRELKGRRRGESENQLLEALRTALGQIKTGKPGPGG